MKESMKFSEGNKESERRVKIKAEKILREIVIRDLPNTRQALAAKHPYTGGLVEKFDQQLREIEKRLADNPELDIKDFPDGFIFQFGDFSFHDLSAHDKEEK